MLGRTDFPLTVDGVQQARRVARRLATYTFDAVYSSPLQRAVATAREVVALHRVPLHWCPGLQEIDCGHADGLDVETAKRRYPELWKLNDDQQDPDFRWPGGESYRDLRRRALAACGTIAARHPGGAAVVVTHSGVINQVLGSLAGLSAAAWKPMRPDHCTITAVEWPPRPSSRPWSLLVR